MSSPLVLTSGAVQFAMQLNLAGMASLSFRVEASTNLVDWLPILIAVTTNETMTVVDPAAAKFNYRFYRAVTQ